MKVCCPVSQVRLPVMYEYVMICTHYYWRNLSREGISRINLLSISGYSRVLFTNWFGNCRRTGAPWGNSISSIGFSGRLRSRFDYEAGQWECQGDMGSAGNSFIWRPQHCTCYHTRQGHRLLRADRRDRVTAPRTILSFAILQLRSYIFNRKYILGCLYSLHIHLSITQAFLSRFRILWTHVVAQSLSCATHFDLRLRRLWERSYQASRIREATAPNAPGFRPPQFPRSGLSHIKSQCLTKFG
jgi:hypothetical protein